MAILNYTGMLLANPALE